MFLRVKVLCSYYIASYIFCIPAERFVVLHSHYRCNNSVVTFTLFTLVANWHKTVAIAIHNLPENVKLPPAEHSLFTVCTYVCVCVCV